MNEVVNKPHSVMDHVHVIIREETEPIFRNGPAEDYIAVTKIWRSEDKAEAEVVRLNEINRDKNCRYFSLLGRLEKSDGDSKI